MNPLQYASDDQVALIGCVAALAGAMTILYVSYFVGPAARRSSNHSLNESTRKFPSQPTGMGSEVVRDKAA